jgi:hypothetical protein
MIKLIKDWQNKLSIKVEGRLSINPPEIASYEAYIKLEEYKQIKEQIYKELLEIVPVNGHLGLFDICERHAHRAAFDKLAGHLAKDYK